MNEPVNQWVTECILASDRWDASQKASPLPWEGGLWVASCRGDRGGPGRAGPVPGLRAKAEANRKVSLCAGFVYWTQLQLPSIYLAAVELTRSQRFWKEQPGKGHKRVLSSEVRFASCMGMGRRGRGRWVCNPGKEVLHCHKKGEHSFKDDKMKNSIYNMCRKQEGRLYTHTSSSMWKIISSGNTGPFQNGNHMAKSRWERLTFHWIPFCASRNFEPWKCIT